MHPDFIKWEWRSHIKHNSSEMCVCGETGKLCASFMHVYESVRAERSSWMFFPFFNMLTKGCLPSIWRLPSAFEEPWSSASLRPPLEERSNNAQLCKVLQSTVPPLLSFSSRSTPTDFLFWVVFSVHTLTHILLFTHTHLQTLHSTSPISTGKHIYFTDIAQPPYSI